MSTAELFAGATFLLVAIVVLVPYYLLVVRPESATQDMLRQRIKTGGSATVVTRTVSAGLLKEVERLSVIGPLQNLLSGDNKFAANLRNTVHLSGVKVTPGQLVTGSACLALVGYIAALNYVPQVWVDVSAGVLLGFLPYAVLRFIRNKKLTKFEEQFPEAIDLIARTLRAGHAFPTGLRMAADELPQPVAGEFKVLYDQQNYGLPMAEGLRAFAQRVPLIDARFFVTAVLTQRESGGNLAEVLDNLSRVIRERFKVKRQLRVISAHGRMTGAVLASLPPALGLFLLVRTPEHFEILIKEPAGIRMITVAVILQLAGAFLIHKITNVEY